MKYYDVAIINKNGKPENDNELELRRFDGSRWVKVRENSETTRNICQWTTTMHYIENSTKEVRNVTCINFGCPVQLSACFYK